MDVAHLIDHTNLKPDARVCDIEKLCREAYEYNFASVCVNPCYVKLAYKLLNGSRVNVCAVVGFPLGAATTKGKVYEAVLAAENGASEIDMVINVSWLKDRRHDLIKKEISSVVSHVPNCLVKVIIETCLLDQEEKIIACKLIKESGAHFVKTSTGFSSGGATVEDIALIRSIVGDAFGVKASGGIRDYDTAAAMVMAGATRLGTSQSVIICKKTI